MYNIYMIGYRGTGKTSVSNLLSKILGRPVVHLDEEFEKENGAITEFVEKNSWQKFRELESMLLKKFSNKKESIVDCGGGIIESEENVKLMKDTGICVWLSASAEIIKKRLKQDKNKRPSLTNYLTSLEEIDEMLEKRFEKYSEASDILIDTDGLPIEKVADMIKQALDRFTKTKLCVSLIENDADSLIKQLGSQKVCDLVELRLDYISSMDETKLKKIIRARKKPAIVTIRSIKAGGKFKGDEKKRISLLKKSIELGIEYLDIEIETDTKSIEDIMSIKGSTKIILSHHDFSGTPDIKDLEKQYGWMNSFHPDFVKIATTAKSINDNFKIFKLMNGKENLIALCMGQKGQITRILAPRFGSLITYASESQGKESADGQLTAKELIEEYNFSTLDRNTEVLGVIGEFAENSKSRFMHNDDFKKLRLNYIYLPFKVSAEELEDFMKNFRDFKFRGAAVTVPHKEAIIQHIDRLDITAKTIGATNTLFNENDKISGSNTDYIGAVEALKEKTGLKEKKILIIGAGGAARAIVYGLKKENAAVTIINRTEEKAKLLAEEFEVKFDRFHNLSLQLNQNDILINTTSVGMNPKPDGIIVDDIPKGKIVMDIVYSPIETRLIKLAKAKKCITITGERMLIHQAIGQFKIWTGQEPRFEDMQDALMKKIGDR